MHATIHRRTSPQVRTQRPHSTHFAGARSALDTRLSRFFGRVLTPFLNRERGRKSRWLLLAGIVIAILASMLLASS